MFKWAYSGVNGSIPGNGGANCASFLSTFNILVETVISLIIAYWLIFWGTKNVSLPKYTNHVTKPQGYKTLLILVCLIWGVEIGFKLASQTIIYILNPCHVTTAMQIYLLAAPPSRSTTALFRIHLNFLNGAVLAFAIPVTDCRILPCEKSIYWIQHTMMMVVPYYLLKLGGPYNVEPLTDMSWCTLSYGCNLVYHFAFLQSFAFPTQVNLNHIMCPTAADPFYGPYYRTMAVLHQALLCPLTCKLFCVICSLFIPIPGWDDPSKKSEGENVSTLVSRQGNTSEGVCKICRCEKRTLIEHTGDNIHLE